MANLDYHGLSLYNSLLDIDKAKALSLAPVFDTATNYDIGDCVTQKGVLYRFTAAHSAGAWIGDDAEAVQLGPAVGALQDLKNWMLGLYPQREIDDVAIATFIDGADEIPVKKLIANITPVQSGSGDPSPDNIRPISGWTGANVHRTGFNLWDEEWELGYLSGSGAEIQSSSHIRAKNYISVLPNTTYYKVTPKAFYNCYYDQNKTFIRNATSGAGTFTTPEGCYYLRFACETSYGTTYNHDISFNYPSTDTIYHAYSGTTIFISFPDAAGTVYGGTIDLTTGLLTVSKISIYANTKTWTYNGTRFVASLSNLIQSTSRLKGICSHYKTFDGSVSEAPDKSIIFTNIPSSNEVYIKDSAYTDVDTFTAAMASVQIVYDVATPLTYQLTPEELTTILGLNNIWADTGDIAQLIYRASLQSQLEKFPAMIAGVENGFTATKNYTAGDFFVVDMVLYKATQNIANGAALTPGVNCSTTTVGAELVSLANT